MEPVAAIMLAHAAGSVAAAAALERCVGFEKLPLWRFLVYPISMGRSLLATVSLRLWIAYAAGVACVILALRLAR